MWQPKGVVDPKLLTAPYPPVSVHCLVAFEGHTIVISEL